MTVITSDKVTYDDANKKLTFTDIGSYPSGDILVTMNVWQSITDSATSTPVTAAFTVNAVDCLTTPI